MVQHFINKLNPSSAREIIGISKEAVKYLKKYNWPGNVRELQNVIEQSMSLTESDVLCLEDLPENVRDAELYSFDAPIETLDFQEAKEKYLNQFYKKYIENLLNKYDGNISMVARKAGMSRWTVYRMMKNVGIQQ